MGEGKGTLTFSASSLEHNYCYRVPRCPKYNVSDVGISKVSPTAVIMTLKPTYINLWKEEKKVVSVNFTASNNEYMFI